jgi:hypothetical protein
MVTSISVALLARKWLFLASRTFFLRGRAATAAHSPKHSQEPVIDAPEDSCHDDGCLDGLASTTRRTAVRESEGKVCARTRLAIRTLPPRWAGLEEGAADGRDAEKKVRI